MTMKKLAILVLFFATSVAIGMEKMNTEYGSNPLLTKAQYNRVMDHWDNIVKRQEIVEKVLRTATSEFQKTDLKNKIEKLTEISNAMYDILHTEPYRAYTNEQLNQLLKN